MRLSGVVTVHTAIVVVQNAVPGVVGCVVLGSTPKDSGYSNTVKTPINITSPTWKGGKTTTIGCTCIG